MSTNAQYFLSAVLYFNVQEFLSGVLIDHNAY